ncbi:MAG: hypothetical protein D6798_15385 [Deltaproteobacteria bacterium]|nr:MAG: hypothetical protein D6798_15385 [Deltaproteobacteria bacterium]
MIGALFTIIFFAWAPDGCTIPECGGDRFDRWPADVADGSWDLWTDIPRMTGHCPDIDGRSLIPEMMQAEIARRDGDLLHLDIGGVHHEAALWGDALYAEGYGATGYASEDGEGVDLEIGVIIEGNVLSREELAGTIYLQVDGTDGVPCEVQARFGAALLTWTEGQPRVCDIPVPLDPEDPVRHPDSGFMCD